jgi:Barrel-sandwich domain of CusB or HlyD membrane-fusion
VRRAACLMALFCLPACGDRAEETKRSEPESAVPGIETAVVTAEPVRDVVLAFAAVAAEAEPPDVRDARTQLAEAAARQQLATQQVARLEALSQGQVAPRKELEAARADEASATAATARARAVLAGFGAAAGRAPLAADETWVIAQLTQPDVLAVTAGADARFTPDALRSQSLAGRVDAPPAYVDPASRTGPVRIRVRDPEHRLRPGMTGSVASEVGEAHPTPAVPVAAIVYDGPQALVFVAEAEGRYVPRRVELGVIRDGRAAVTAGLEPGTRVATTGAASLLSAARLPAAGGED